MSTTITISPAAKHELEDLRDEEFGLPSLNATILRLMSEPKEHASTEEAEDAELTEPVKVSQPTRALLERARDTEGFADYDAVIRDRAGLHARDRGEQPIPVSPL